MPILFIPEPPPPPIPLNPLPRLRDYPCKNIRWHAPSGEVISFRDYPYSMLPGRRGFGRVEHQIISDMLVNGSHFVQNYRPQTRVLNIPFAVNTDQADYEQAADEMRAAYSRLDVAFQHKLCGGNIVSGEIEVQLVDGTSRFIRAFYQGGFDGTEDIIDDLSLRYQPFPNLEFWCPDAAFQGEEVVHTFLVESEVDFKAFYPIYPIGLKTSGIEGLQEFTNDSPEPIYPVWEITGPGEPSLENLETGEELVFTEPIPGGETVVVDTRPVSIAPETGGTITNTTTGESWWDRVNGDLFAICPGPVRFNFFMAGASAESRLILRYRQRYMRGW